MLGEFLFQETAVSIFIFSFSFLIKLSFPTRRVILHWHFLPKTPYHIVKIAPLMRFHCTSGIGLSVLKKAEDMSKWGKTTTTKTDCKERPRRYPAVKATAFSSAVRFPSSSSNAQAFG